MSLASIVRHLIFILQIIENHLVPKHFPNDIAESTEIDTDPQDPHIDTENIAIETNYTYHEPLHEPDEALPCLQSPEF